VCDPYRRVDVGSLDRHFEDRVERIALADTSVQMQASAWPR
jgi:hypothetical protein